MTSLTDALDRLSPRATWESDWGDVLRRANERTSRRRRVALAGAVAAAVLIPLTAVAAVGDWWFFGAKGLPRPTGKPVVVTRGIWSGHPWTLVAYPSKGEGLCWGMTFSGPVPPPFQAGISRSAHVALHGVADGVGCGSIVGLQVPRLRAADVPTVAFESVISTSRGYPSWISGVVVATASHVVIRWPSGRALRVATYAAPVADYRVRLFAAPVPRSVLRSSYPRSITGTDRERRVVACFLATDYNHGITALSLCRR